MDEIMTPRWLAEWQVYWKSKPFGHWIDTQMRASIAASNTTGKQDDFIPRVQEVSELTEEEQLMLIPGAGGAAQFLQEIYGNNQNA
jgi:hypothetical protein